MTMLLAASLLVPSPLQAAETRAAVPGAPAPAAALADLGWLVGTWEGEGLGGAVLESYSPPAGGQIAGHFRLLKDGKPQFYELLMIAEVGASLEFRVKHFNPDMTGWGRRRRSCASRSSRSTRTSGISTASPSGAPAPTARCRPS